MNDQHINNKHQDKIQYKEYLRKSGQGMIDVSSGKVFDPRKQSTQKNCNLDFVVTSDNKKEGKSYLNLSKGDKAKQVNHIEAKKDVSSYKKSFSKKMSETHSQVNLKTKDSNELIELGGIKKQKNRVSNIYPNNFNFFLKNSTSNSNRTEINRKSNEKKSIMSPPTRICNDKAKLFSLNQNDIIEPLYKDMKALNLLKYFLYN